MFYPQALQDFRTKLSLRRGQTRSVYEVLAPDLPDATYTTNNFEDGVFNSNKKHWAIGWSNVIFSFVWNVEHKKGESCVVGAKWVSHPDFLDDYEQDLHWIGYTSLNVNEIKNAGKYFVQSEETKVQVTGFVSMRDVHMSYGVDDQSFLKAYFISFLMTQKIISFYLLLNYLQ